MKPKLINISGSSGVGKTTIAKMVGFILSDSNNNILHLCGDDLHKWERDDKNWNKFTHLNPTANNINEGNIKLKYLMNGVTIKRDIYNHDNGKFIKDVKIKPADIIINEGLHSLYDSHICRLADLNIFVNTDKELTKEWKISRDVSSRGYTEEQVISIMKMREKDDKEYIQPQINNSDAVINFNKKEYDSVSMQIESSLKNNELLEKLNDFYYLHKRFIISCRSLSFEYDLIQGAGGNLSYKFDNAFVVYKVALLFLIARWPASRLGKLQLAILMVLGQPQT